MITKLMAGWKKLARLSTGYNGGSDRTALLDGIRAGFSMQICILMTQPYQA
jgi:hypothetical protein